MVTLFADGELKEFDEINVIWFPHIKSSFMDVTEGKLNAPQGIDVIWFFPKLIEADVAFGKPKAPEAIDEIWLFCKNCH